MAKAEDDNWNGMVILGKTQTGGRFRPSDWCERLHGVLRALDEEDAAAFAGCVRLVNYQGNKAVWVDRRLQDENEQLFSFFRRFADDNQLQTVRVSQI